MTLTTTTTTDAERLAQIEEVVRPYRMANCASMQHLAKHGVDRAVAREIARQYYPANVASPLIMAAGIANIWDETLRMALVSNLYEECGKLEPSCSHIALFRRFVEALDIDPETVTRAEPNSPTARLVDTYRGVCMEGPAYRALAILFAFEDVFCYVCDLIARGLRKSGIVDEHAAEFFPLHAIADVVHAERMRAAMLEAADTDAKWQESLALIDEGARLLYDLFDSIARTATHPAS